MTPNKPESDDRKSRQKKRSIALGLILAALVLVFYALTIVKMGPSVFDRPL